MSSETVYTVYISYQRLQTFIRYTYDQLKLQLSRIMKTHFASLLIHLGKCFIKKHQTDLRITVCLLHIEHRKACKQCDIFRVLSLSSGVTTCHIIDCIFADIPILILYLFIHTESQIITIIHILFHLLTILA